MFKQIVATTCAVLLLACWGMATGTAAPEPYPSSSPYGEEYPSGSYMGIDVQEITPERVQALKLKEERGVEITMVDQDAPAGKAGLKEHDVILQFNGEKVEGVEQLRRMIRETPPGRNVSLGISRNGQPMQLTMQLADRKQAAAHWKDNNKITVPPIPPIVIPSIDVSVRSVSRCGLVVDNLTPQLGEFFGVKNGEGVLVRSVEKGSPAEAAGFRAGDVIVRVENDKIADRGDWRSALHSHPSGKMSVGIIRDRREQTLSLTMPPGKDNQSAVEIDVPDLQAQLQDLEVALNRMRPEIERASREAAQQSEQVLEQNQEALRKAQEEMKKAMEKAGPELERQMKCLEQQLEKAQHDIEITIQDE